MHTLDEINFMRDWLYQNGIDCSWLPDSKVIELYRDETCYIEPDE